MGNAEELKRFNEADPDCTCPLDPDEPKDPDCPIHPEDIDACD